MKNFILPIVAAFLVIGVACQQKSEPLYGTWLIETAFEQPVVVADTALIMFDAEKMHVAGCNGCNRFFGPYISGVKDSLSLKNLATTMMACPDSPSQDDIMRAFAETATYSIKKEGDNTRLFLYDNNKKEVMALSLKSVTIEK